jgi:hypothetical protein
MVFGNLSEQDKKKVTINIGGQRLDIVDKTKFLGVILDNSLNWKPHIHYITQKLAKSIGILSQARKVLDRKTLIQLYYSFIYPYINYCNLSWGNSPESILWPIFRLQKIAIRIVFNIRHRSSTQAVCKSFTLLRLPDIHLLNIGIFMHKYKYNLLPNIFNDFFIENRSIHNYPTRSAANLRIPKVRTNIAERFIRKTGVNFWNLVSGILETNCSIYTFKRHLKKYLVRNYI